MPSKNQGAKNECQKLLILTSMSLAAIAFAAPASAFAGEDAFTHQGALIEHPSPVEATFSGSFGFVITGTETGVHCETVQTSLALKATGTGTVDNVEAEGCTTTPDNLPAHVTAVGLPWTIHANSWLDIIEITDIHLNSKVTHPQTPHLVVAESTLTGDVDAHIPQGQTDNIGTVVLKGLNATVHVHPDEHSANVTGHLQRGTETQIGIITLG